MELQILDALQTIHTPVLDAMMCGITRLGDAGIIWILLCIVLLVLPKTRKSGVILMAALLVDLVICNGILKPLVHRIRPFDVKTGIELLVKRPTDYSFPSGHTAASFASVMALYLAGEKRLWIPALVLAVLIAFSRLYLYVHYPTDVLGGVVAGLAAGALGYWLVKKVSELKKA